jgi:hypothetical protein
MRDAATRCKRVSVSNPMIKAVGQLLPVLGLEAQLSASFQNACICSRLRDPLVSCTRMINPQHAESLQAHLA